MGKPIDMVAVRESLAALDRIAREHPELLGESTTEEWETVLKERGLERQKRLIAKRQAEGQERHALWAPKDDIAELRQRFPGPRNGVNWLAVIAAALNKNGQHGKEADRTALPSLEGFREALPEQPIGAGEFCRAMRDDERY